MTRRVLPAPCHPAPAPEGRGVPSPRTKSRHQRNARLQGALAGEDLNEGVVLCGVSEF